MTGLLLALALHATPAQASVYREFQGVRSTAMGGAHRGEGSTNDTLYLNPAGMATSQRYALEFNYGYSPFDDLTQINISAVDSKSGPIAGGVGYTNIRGDDNGVDPKLHRIYTGIAYALTKQISFGVTGRNVRGSFTNALGEREDFSLYTGDVGVMAMLSGNFRLGASFNNVVDTDQDLLTPKTLGFGASYVSDRLTIAADMKMDMSQSETLNSYHGGIEYSFYSEGLVIPLRVGYQRTPEFALDGDSKFYDIVSGGLALVSSGGALDITYTRATNDDDNWMFVGALRFFM